MIYREMTIYQKLEYWQAYLDGLIDLIKYEPNTLEYIEMVELSGEIYRVQITLEALRSTVERAVEVRLSWYNENEYDFELGK